MVKELKFKNYHKDMADGVSTDQILNNNQNVDHKGILLLIKTVQCSAFKNLLETLKEILTDCNLVFDNDGMKCLTVDSSQSVIVSVKLNHGSFEHFYCKSKLVCGVNLNNMFRLIKSISTSDTLTLKVLDSDPNRLIIVSQNTDKAQCTTHKLNMLDIDEMCIEIPNTNFESVLTMPATDFQRICRDLAVISEHMGINSQDKKLILSSIGDFAEQVTEIGEREHGMYFTTNTSSDTPVHYGSFLLKYLTQFAKASVMCGTVDLYLKPGYPLILSYSVASLGRLLFVLARDAHTD